MWELRASELALTLRASSGSAKVTPITNEIDMMGRLEKKRELCCRGWERLRGVEKELEGPRETFSPRQTQGSDTFLNWRAMQPDGTDPSGFYKEAEPVVSPLFPGRWRNSSNLWIMWSLFWSRIPQFGRHFFVQLTTWINVLPWPLSLVFKASLVNLACAGIANMVYLLRAFKIKFFFLI